MPIRVYIIENHPRFREMLGKFINYLPNMVTCGAAHYGQEALTQIPEVKPDLVIVDLALPDMNGTEVIRRLQQSLPDLPTLILSTYQQPHYVRRALEAGALGYVLKGDPMELEKAIQKVLAGNIYLSPQLKLFTDSRERLSSLHQRRPIDEEG